MPPALRNALVWCLLVLVPAGWIALSNWEPAPQGEAAPSEEAERVGSVTEMKGRLLLQFSPAELTKPDPLGTRPLSRLGAAMLLARVGDREAAEAQCRLASESEGVDPELVRAVRVLVARWPQAEGGQDRRSPVPDVLDGAQWTLVQQRLGWFGELARSDFDGDAASTARARDGESTMLVTLVVAGVWFLGVGSMGLVGLVVIVALACLGRIRSAVQAMPRTQSILGETFVVWMLLFLGMHLLMGRLSHGVEPTAERLWVGLGASFASLSALGWAYWRGLSWDEVRDAVGLRFQGGAWRLAWMSGVSYACALPCMGAGLLLGLLLAEVLGDRSFQDVTHPVQEMLPTASPAMKVALFALASVQAPIVEEIAFRGLLYGHARQQSARWPRALSIALAMLFSATIFAAIHPQGVLAVPALAGISLGFCLTREWSGSVLPGMVAHGLHNGLMLALNLALQAA